VRSAGLRNKTANTVATGTDAPRWSVLRRLGWSFRDLSGLVVGLIAIGAILVNSLFLQPGPHPAPIFGIAPLAAAETRLATVGSVPLPRTAPPARTEPARSEPGNADAPPPHPAGEVITEVQRELARRGFYEGAVDGVFGSRTDAAIRAFAQAAGLKAAGEPNAALLRAIKNSNVKAAKNTAPAPSAAPVRSAPARNDAITELLAPSKRVVAVQRALADYGYGQIRPTGVLDRETKGAIERFERERKLPVTGAVSERITRELAAVTGHPVE
jgi:peptidoglycan hydrolase-like protein with peptidoglycan-binding domain